MNFDDMSDFDVNRCLAMALDGVKWGDDFEPLFAVDCFLHDWNDTSVIVYWSNNDKEACHVDYCNSWADMGPLIAEHKLSLEPHASSDTYFSATRHCEFNHQDKNPLRAAAICLIKKLEAENE